MARARAQHVGPERPRRRGVALRRRPGHDLDLRHARGALADRRADAVAAGVAAADHEDLLAPGVDRRRGQLPREEAVLPLEQLQREVHALQVAPRNRQVARGGRADREDDRVEAPREPRGRDVRPDLDARLEADALRLEDRAAAVDERLVELEARDAVAQESADVRAALEDRHRPAAAPQRHGRREPGRARADDRRAPPVLRRRRARDDPAALERGVDDPLLRLAHHHRLLVELVHAGRLAERGADARRELGEVRPPREQLPGAAPVALRHGAVLVRHEVPERAPRPVAERLPAVHAAGDLLADLAVGERALDLAPVARPFLDGPVDVVDSLHAGRFGSSLVRGRLCRRSLPQSNPRARPFRARIHARIRTICVAPPDPSRQKM